MKICAQFLKWIFVSLSMLFLLAPLTVLAQTKVVVIPLGDDAKPLKNIITVAKANGNFTDPVAAVNSIKDASAANPYLVVIGPGVYTITQTLYMKRYVDIVGSGENVTKLTGAISGDWNASSIISGANNSELSSLTLENTGGHFYSVALFNYHASPRVSNVTATASGGSANRGIYNEISSPTMTDVTATALGGLDTMGVYNSASSPTMTNVTATASGGTLSNHGVYNLFAPPPKTSLTMTSVTATASGGTGTHNRGVLNWSSSPTMANVTATASGGTDSHGVHNYESSSPTMTDVTATGSDGISNCGVYNESSSSPTMTEVTATASGGTNSYGVYNASSVATMTNITARASEGTSNNWGVGNIGSVAIMTNVTATALGGTTNFGVYNSPDSHSAIRRGTISGNTKSLHSEGISSTATVSHSTITNGVSGTGIIKCVFCDNGSGDALGADCK